MQDVGKYYVSYDVSSAKLTIKYQNEEIVRGRSLKGLGILPDTPEMHKFIEDAIFCSGRADIYRTCRYIYMKKGVSKFIIDKDIDTKRLSKAEYASLCYKCKLNEDTLHLGAPYADVHGFYNMVDAPLAFKCRFSYLIDWFKMNKINKDIKYIIATNMFNFIGVDENNNIIRRFWVRKKPLMKGYKTDIIYEGYVYMIGMR